MAITPNDFSKIWASNADTPEYTFTEADYLKGWDFVGNLPPTRAMWNELQRKNDEKMQFLQENGSMCFDSVTDMKSSNLDAGQTAFTKGYYSVNDGGSSIYAIRAKTQDDVDDGGSIIVLDNGNVAELITDGTVNVKQFGAKGDGTTDDTEAIQKALNVGSTVIFPDGIYMVDAVKQLKIVSRENMHIIISPNAEVKAITMSEANYNIFSLSRCKNITIDGGGKITGDVGTHTGTGGEWGIGIKIPNSSNILIDNLEISKCWGDSIYIGNDYGEPQSENVTVRNCYLHHSRRQGISIVYGRDILIDSCLITDISGTAPQAGIDIETEGTENPVAPQENIRITNTTIKNCSGASILTVGLMKGISITDCTLDMYSAYALNGDVSVHNCILSANITEEQSLDGALLTIENCTANKLDSKSSSIKIIVNNCKLKTFNINGKGSANNSTIEYIFCGANNRFNGCTIIAEIYGGTSNAFFNDCNISANMWDTTFNILSFEHCQIILGINKSILFTITQKYTLKDCSFIVNAEQWASTMYANGAECVLINNDFNFDTVKKGSGSPAHLMYVEAKTLRVIGNVFHNANAPALPLTGYNISLLQSQNNIALDTADIINLTMASDGKKYIINNITSQTPPSE